MKENDCHRLMQGKPAFFRYSPLKAVWNVAGLSEAYVAVLNDRFGLDFRKVDDGIDVRRFDSLLDFAFETGNGRFIRLLRECDAETARNWGKLYPFDVPWIKLRPSGIQDQDQSISLVLAPEGAELFFEIMDFYNLSGYRGFVHEIAYRFGLRKLAAA